MKKVILGVHENEKSGFIRYWEYTDETVGSWRVDLARTEEDMSKYAIVDTCNGWQLVKVVGIAEVSDDVRAEKKVLLFVDNMDLPIKEGNEEN